MHCGNRPAGQASTVPGRFGLRYAGNQYRRAMAAVPLRRNREFVLFQTGQLLSDAGSASTAIAYPLLVLALTHSPARAGIVAFARALPLALLALPAGLLADHWSRKRVMILADAIRVAAVGVLAGAVLSDHAHFWLLPVIAFVEGAGSAMFSAAQVGAMRAVVPIDQLQQAVATQTGRKATVQLTGPPLGGVLFAVARALPFVVDAASYVFSTASLLLLRTPLQQQRESESGSVRERLWEGLRFVWDEPFLRTTAMLFGLGNFFLPGLTFTLVVLAKRRGLSGGEVGALVAVFGACILLGSVISPLVRRLLPARGVLLLEFWTYLGCAAFLVWPNVFVLTACLAPTGLAIASSDSIVHGLRIAMTPDRLLSRVDSARSMISLTIAPLGPLLAGILLSDSTPRVTMTVFLAAGAAIALWGTLSPAIRSAPRFEDLLSNSSAAAADAP